MVWNVTKLSGLGRFEVQCNSEQVKRMSRLAKYYGVRQEDILASVLIYGMIQTNLNMEDKLAEQAKHSNLEARLKAEGDYR